MKSKNAIKTLCISLILFAFAIKVNAQDSTKNHQTTTINSLTKIKAYLIGIGIEREQNVGNQSSIYFGGAIESVVPFFPMQPFGASDALMIDYSINFSPLVYLGFRNYYNLLSRTKKGKATKNNSASFVGLEYSLIAPILIHKRYTSNFVNSISPVWGFQHNLSKNLNLELVIGPSFQTDFTKSRVSALVKFGFSYLL